MKEWEKWKLLFRVSGLECGNGRKNGHYCIGFRELGFRIRAP